MIDRLRRFVVRVGGRLRRAVVWMGPRLRSFLGWTALGIALVVVLAGSAVAILLITNPDPSDSSGWSRHEDAPSARSETASAVAGGRLFVMGGFEGLYDTSDDVEVYAVGRDVWEDGPELPARRHHAAAAALGDVVYVSGGGSSAFDWSPAREMWALQPGDDRWERQPPMPEPRLGHDMVEVDGRLYVFGGEGGSDRVLRFDPAEGWSVASEVPGRARDHVRAVAVDGEVWVIGGRHDDLSRRVDVYDPASDSWREGPPLPKGMSAMAVGVVEGVMHVVGGEDPSLFGGTVFDDHFALDPRTGDGWGRTSSPMLAVHGAGYGVVDGRLYIAGGARRQGPLSSLAFTGLVQSYSPSDVDDGR